MPDLSLGYDVGGEGDLCRVCECRRHRICIWFRHRYDVVGGLREGILLRAGEDVRAMHLVLV